MSFFIPLILSYWRMMYCTALVFLSFFLIILSFFFDMYA